MMGTSIPRRLVGGPAGFRRLLERLGPTFVKLGQFLALRPEIIPQEYADELMRLLDRVEPFGWSEARAVIDAELGASVRNFRYIDAKPVAAGSLAQVHRATTLDGRSVALKILRPGIRARVSADLRRVRRIARIIRLAEPNSVLDPAEIAAELRSWLERELDFAQEASNIERLRGLVGNDPAIVIPRVYRDLTTASVLTTDYVEGIPFSEILETTDRAPLDKLGFDARVLAETLVRSTLRQVFEFQFFHADVHPGNLLFLPANAIGYVDFGLCESIDQTVSREQARYLAAVYSHDAPRMFQALLELLIPGDRADADGLRTDFMNESARWLHDGYEHTAERSPIAQFLLGVMSAARKNRFQVPSRLLAMYRTFLTTETTAHRLSRDVDLGTVGSDFLLDLQVRNAVRETTPAELGKQLLSLLDLIRESPGRASQILSELTERRLPIRVVKSEDAADGRARHAYTRMIAAGMASLAVAFWAAQNAARLRGSLWAIPLALLASLYLYMFVQWRSAR